MTTRHEIFGGRDDDGNQVVKMVANTGYEPQVFDDWDVLNEFIDELQAVALKVWGHPALPKDIQEKIKK